MSSLFIIETSMVQTFSSWRRRDRCREARCLPDVEVGVRGEEGCGENGTIRFFVAVCQSFLVKTYQNGGNYHKIHQISVKYTITYTKIYHSKALPNLPKMGFFGTQIYHLETLACEVIVVGQMSTSPFLPLYLSPKKHS
jgi:hypothetical protein